MHSYLIYELNAKHKEINNACVKKRGSRLLKSKFALTKKDGYQIWCEYCPVSNCRQIGCQAVVKGTVHPKLFACVTFLSSEIFI